METIESDKIVENPPKGDEEINTENESDKNNGNTTALKPKESSEEQSESMEVDKEAEKEISESEKVNDDEPQKIQQSEELKTRKRKISETKTDESEKSSEKSSNEENKNEPKENEKETGIEPPAQQEANIPPKETPDINLGKGKRARIPNKRYSDIILSPPTRLSYKSSLSNLENGERSHTTDTDHDLEEINRTSSPATKKQKLTDITNPNFLKPFKYGWKRELVYRAHTDSNNRRVPGDIYYYTPQGKKIKSYRELSEILPKQYKELSVEDFTFAKEALGVNDPEKEIIRDAKIGKKQQTFQNKVTKSPKALSPKLSQSKNKGLETPSTPKSTAKGKTQKATTKKGQEVENLEIDTPQNSARPKRKAPKTGRYSPDTSATMLKRRGNKNEPPQSSPQSSQLLQQLTETKSEEKTNFLSDNYLQAISYGYKTLLHIFQYLKVQDILRASCVCHMWHDIASHPSLWRTVRMKNSQVHSFEGLANSLKKHGTIHLDLRKMLLPTNGGGDDIWQEFSKAIKRVESLRKIELCRCPANVIEQLPLTNPDLEVINAVTIKCETLNLDNMKELRCLKELRLKSINGIQLNSNLNALDNLRSLRVLSLTSVKDLDKIDLNVIGNLIHLESLDLGECNAFPSTFADILLKLTKLEKLRLEKGQDNCATFDILDAVSKLKKLEQLELINFDIKPGFDLALGKCVNLKKLLLIPTYISQSATTNHMVLSGVLRLHSTLLYFVWGVTLELLRVTELFIDQCEDPESKKQEKPPTTTTTKEKKAINDSIPILKPVPVLLKNNNDEIEITPADDPPQVEILSLTNLQKILLQNLPTTKVKILKIPFHATWRQSITDTVNV